jgi:DNA-binding PucR family transcriptional regulator
VLLARQRIPGAEDDSPDARERRDAVRRELRLLAPARRLALRGDADSLEIRAVLAVDGQGGTDPEGLAIAARMGSFLDRTVAISRPFGAALERPTAEAEARATLEGAESLAEPPRVARAARLPVYRLLGGLHNLPDGERLSQALLEPLLRGRADVRREHLATLRALLDHGGVNEAAVALGVHRNTVAYRVRRIEELTGWRLSDPEVRLPLAVALRLVQDD